MPQVDVQLNNVSHLVVVVHVETVGIPVICVRSVKSQANLSEDHCLILESHASADGAIVTLRSEYFNGSRARGQMALTRTSRVTG